ncbi:GMP/IMP nucleotidase [Candidatus Pseudothioglobus sp. Uisw_016]|uniref:GMP/IMP nucleotidase n=1 Tax=Candidatus Pseudothioglobus sp. Uisw_016 TaxID=3230995 RepID=UPI003A8BE5BE
MAHPGEENKLNSYVDWSQIDTILLDLDGTLLDLNFDLHFWLKYLPNVYSEKHNTSFEDSKNIILSMLDSQEGKLTWYCLDYWEEKLDFDIMKLKGDIAHLIQVHNHVINFLITARSKEKRIYLVTNAHRKGIALKMQMSKLEGYFDKIISSHDFGVIKQEQQFWEQLSTVIDFDNERTIFFDDSLDVLESASTFKIKNIIAINKPSSMIDKKIVPGFINIESFLEVMP